MILGVSGPYASGKGEVMAFLEERSFRVYSLSDVIRAELARTATGKLQKFKLREPYWKDFEKGIN